MSQENVLKGMRVKVSRLSHDKDNNATDPKPLVFYRCTCPRCHNESLRLRGFGQLDRGLFVGVTGKGTPGLVYDELDQDCDPGITCHDCGFDGYLQGAHQSNTLLEWARQTGEELPALRFTCPACGTHELMQVQLEVEIHSVIAAVCEIDSEAVPDRRAMVTLTGEQLLLAGGPFRFCCENGHELAKDDGTPVETADELVAWLKANYAGDKG